MKKMFKYTLLLIFFHSFIFSDGPYNVNIITEQDGLRNGPYYSGGIVYYPVDVDGPLPVLVLVPGFVSSISSIEDWGPYLASYGIVTMFVNVNNIFQDPYYRSSALLDGLISINEENSRYNSPLFNNLNIYNSAVGGWSMGGGGAQIAAQQNQDINAVIAMSPWLPNSNITLNNETPILFLSGQYDSVAPNYLHTDVFYSNTPISTDKLLFEISGGNHQTVCSPYNNISMGLKTVYFIEKYIADNSINCDDLISVPLFSSDFLTNIVCESNILGDLNEDNFLNVQDIILLIDLILLNSYSELGDLNYDNYLNVQDVIMLTSLILNDN